MVGPLFLLLVGSASIYSTDARLIEMLNQERVVTASVSAGADLLAELTRANDQLQLLVTDRYGHVLVRRAIDLERGEEAALRIALVLVREAAATFVEYRPSTPLSPPLQGDLDPHHTALPSGRTAPIEVIVRAGVQSLWWLEQSAPQLGFTADGALAFDRVRVGLGVAVAGAPICCRKRTIDLEAEVRDHRALVEVSFTMAETPIWRLAPLVAAGLSVVEGEARARAFAGPGTARSFTRFGGMVRGGAEIGLSLPPLEVRLALALEVALRETEITLPAGLETAAEPLRTGRFLPWIGLSVGWRLR